MKRPTSTQQRFINEYVDNGGNGVQAALEAYDTGDYNTANQIAMENLQKPTVQGELARCMKEADLTLKDAVQAVKRNIGSEAPAATQMSAAREVFKLPGAYPSKAFDASHRHSHISPGFGQRNVEAAN